MLGNFLVIVGVIAVPTSCQFSCEDLFPGLTICYNGGSCYVKANGAIACHCKPCYFGRDCLARNNSCTQETAVSSSYTVTTSTSSPATAVAKSSPTTSVARNSVAEGPSPCDVSGMQFCYNGGTCYQKPTGHAGCHCRPCFTSWDCLVAIKNCTPEVTTGITATTESATTSEYRVSTSVIPSINNNSDLPLAPSADDMTAVYVGIGAGVSAVFVISLVLLFYVALQRCHSLTKKNKYHVSTGGDFRSTYIVYSEGDGRNQFLISGLLPYLSRNNIDCQAINVKSLHGKGIGKSGDILGVILLFTETAIRDENSLNSFKEVREKLRKSRAKTMLLFTDSYRNITDSATDVVRRTSGDEKVLFLPDNRISEYEMAEFWNELYNFIYNSSLPVPAVEVNVNNAGVRNEVDGSFEDLPTGVYNEIDIERMDNTGLYIPDIQTGNSSVQLTGVYSSINSAALPTTLHT